MPTTLLLLLMALSLQEAALERASMLPGKTLPSPASFESGDLAAHVPLHLR